MSWSEGELDEDDDELATMTGNTAGDPLPSNASVGSTIGSSDVPPQTQMQTQQKEEHEGHDKDGLLTTEVDNQKADPTHKHKPKPDDLNNQTMFMVTQTELDKMKKDIVESVLAQINAKVKNLIDDGNALVMNHILPLFEECCGMI